MAYLPWLSLLVLCVLLVFRYFQSSSESSENEDMTVVPLIRRHEWGAKPPGSPPHPLEVLPPSLVIISEETGPIHTFCYTETQCKLNVRENQAFFVIFKEQNDIAYNFLVGGDGNVYEGRGWGVEGAHTFGFNHRSLGISFIGKFESNEPEPEQLAAAQSLIQFGVRNGKISKDYKLVGHRQCNSPGHKLYEIIKTWDHWSPECE